MSVLILAAQVLAVLTGTADTRALHVDPDGTVWAGTTGGLVRASGDERRVFTPADGLPDGTVRALLRKGDTLWVGTDRGVARCATDGAELTVEAVHGLRLRVEAIAIHDGKVWLGATTGLFFLEAGELHQQSRMERVTALASAGDALYAASPGHGTYRIVDGRRRRLRGDRLAWDLTMKADELWVATSRGLERYRGRRRLPSRAVRASRRIPRRDLRAVTVHEGTLVVGSFGGGAWRFDERRFRPVEGIDPGARVQALALGTGWLAGTPEGVVGQGAVTPPSTLPDNDLSALARTSEGLWIGTFDHGLVLRRDDGTFETVDEAGGLLDDRVNRLAVDGEGDLWVATDRGVVERQGEGFALRGLLDRHVFALGFVDGAIHAGAGAEVFAFIDGAFRPVEQPGERPQDFAEHSAGGVLVASAEGLARRQEGRWGLTTSDDGLMDDWVTAVAIASGDAAYLGTYASGVARIAEDRVDTLRDDLWVNAGALAWLPSPAGDDLLAVGTLDDGLWLHAAETERWERLGTAEGLPDDDVTAVLSIGDGTLWVATRGGLAHVAPR